MKKYILIAVIAGVIVASVAGGLIFATKHNEQNKVAEQLQTAQQYVQTNNYSKALTEYNEVLTIDPNNKTAQLLSSIVASYIKANQQYISEDYKGALTTLNNINAQYTNYPIQSPIATLRNQVTAKIANQEKAAQAQKEQEAQEAKKAATPIIINTSSTPTGQPTATGLNALSKYSQAKGTIGGAGYADVVLNFNQYDPSTTYISGTECYPKYPKQIYNINVYSNSSTSNSYEIDEIYNGEQTGTYSLTLNGNTLTGTFTNQSTGESSYVNLTLS